MVMGVKFENGKLRLERQGISEDSSYLVDFYIQVLAPSLARET